MDDMAPGQDSVFKPRANVGRALSALQPEAPGSPRAPSPDKEAPGKWLQEAAGWLALGTQDSMAIGLKVES